MRLVGACSFLVALAACGAKQDFSGTYAASLSAVAADGGAGSVASDETWIVSSSDHSWPAKHDYTIEVRRGGAVVCTLTGSHAGGYDLAIRSGGSCARGGVAATLDAGTLHGNGDDLHAELTWSLASGGKLTETGTLTKSK